MLEWFSEIPILVLMMVRLTAFFVAAPIFTIKGVPNVFKVGFSFFLALLAYLTIDLNWTPTLDFTYLMLLIKEAIVGLSLGFIAMLILYAVQVAGAFIDFQMGFLIANLVDPQTGAQIPVIGNFKYIITILFLLSINGHHLLLSGILQSYQIIPVDVIFVSIGSEQVAYHVASTFAKMFLIAFQIAIPVAGALFLVEVCLGILAKTVPQLNVFVVGLPIKIFVGLCLLLITMGGFFMALHLLVEHMVQAMTDLMNILGG